MKKIIYPACICLFFLLLLSAAYGYAGAYNRLDVYVGEGGTANLYGSRSYPVDRFGESTERIVATPARRGQYSAVDYRVADFKVVNAEIVEQVEDTITIRWKGAAEVFITFELVSPSAQPESVYIGYAYRIEGSKDRLFSVEVNKGSPYTVTFPARIEDRPRRGAYAIQSDADLGHYLDRVVEVDDRGNVIEDYGSDYPDETTVMLGPVTASRYLVAFYYDDPKVHHVRKISCKKSGESSEEVGLFGVVYKSEYGFSAPGRMTREVTYIDNGEEVKANINYYIYEVSYQDKVFTTSDTNYPDSTYFSFIVEEDSDVVVAYKNDPYVTVTQVRCDRNGESSVDVSEIQKRYDIDDYHCSFGQTQGETHYIAPLTINGRRMRLAYPGEAICHIDRSSLARSDYYINVRILPNPIITETITEVGELIITREHMVKYYGDKTFGISLERNSYYLQDVVVGVASGAKIIPRDCGSKGRIKQYTFTNVKQDRTIEEKYLPNPVITFQSQRENFLYAPQTGQVTYESRPEYDIPQLKDGVKLAYVLATQNGETVNLGKVLTHKFAPVVGPCNLFMYYSQAYTVRTHPKSSLYVGSIAPDAWEAPIIAYYGEEISFTFYPAEGYKVARVVLDDVSVGATNSYTLKVTRHHLLEVLFMRNIYAMDPDGGVTAEPGAEDPDIASAGIAATGGGSIAPEAPGFGMSGVEAPCLGAPDEEFTLYGSGEPEDMSSVVPISLQRTFASGNILTLDIDQDGKEDICVWESDSLAVYLNKGNGKFRDITSISGISLISSFIISEVYIIDLNNDGSPDIYVSGRERGSTLKDESNKMYLNNADGTFTDLTDASDVKDVSGIKTLFADIDSDDDADAYTLSAAGSENRLLVNNGMGVFADETDWRGLGGLSGEHFLFVDFDEDGDVDLLGEKIDSTGEPCVDFFINDGQGYFTEDTPHVLAD